VQSLGNRSDRIRLNSRRARAAIGARDGKRPPGARQSENGSSNPQQDRFFHLGDR
jgi:hypothetical protein